MNSREKKINISKTLIKTSSSMPNILTKSKLDIKDFGLFTKYIDKQLSFYNIDPKEFGDTHSNFNQTNTRLGKNEKQFLRTMKARNPMANLKRDPNVYNTTFMTVSVKNNYYENPLHSLNILKKNYNIAHDIVKKNIYRQKSIFNDTIRKIKLNKVFYKKKMPFMKISTLMPNLKKDYAFFSIKNMSANNNQNNNNDNNAKNVESENNSLNSKSKKNKNLKGYKSNNDKFSNPYTKLICLYRYSHKNFPESREQFSLITCDEYIYLIGGISCINEIDEIWKYNTSNLTWTKIKINNKTLSRFGHTATLDRNKSKIYIFGGRSKMDIWSHSISSEKKELFGNIEYSNFTLPS